MLFASLRKILPPLSPSGRGARSQRRKDTTRRMARGVEVVSEPTQGDSRAALIFLPQLPQLRPNEGGRARAPLQG